MRSNKLSVLLSIIFIFAIKAEPQSVPDLDQGLKAFGSYHGGALDTVSLSNGNLFFHADLMAYSQRGGELAYPLQLLYNNKNFRLKQTCQPPPSHICTISVVVNNPNGGPYSGNPSVVVGFAGLPVVIGGVGPGINTGLSLNGSPIYVHLYSVQTPGGAQHPLANTGSYYETIDGSGYR